MTVATTTNAFSTAAVNLIYLAGAVATVAITARIAPNAPTAVVLIVAVIAVLVAVGTLNRPTDEVVDILGAVNDLIRGRPSP